MKRLFVSSVHGRAVKSPLDSETLTQAATKPVLKAPEKRSGKGKVPAKKKQPAGGKKKAA